MRVKRVEEVALTLEEYNMLIKLHNALEELNIENESVDDLRGAIENFLEECSADLD